jgi:hypothetical protein
MMMQLLPKIFRQVDNTQQRDDDELIRYEAQIGGQLFGALPKGHRREFFCLDEHTWVWHEEWTDENGKRQVVTTRYDVRPSGILKAQGSQYQPLSTQETINLYQAIELYEQQVGAAYDKMLQAA